MIIETEKAGMIVKMTETEGTAQTGALEVQQTVKTDV